MKRQFDLKEHSIHIKAIFTALRSIFQQGDFADKAIEKVMKANKKWGVRERTFVSVTVYDMVRNWRFFNASANIEGTLTERNLWSLFATWLIFKGYTLPESGHFKTIDEKKIKMRFEKFEKIPKLNESVPDWLDELGKKELGSNWPKVMHALNKPPTTVLRVNLLKTTVDELKQKLEGDNIPTETIAWAPDALRLVYSRNVFRTEAFHQGLFEVQDAGSQMVANFLDVKPGDRVVDGCAGAGGKTLHLAALMKNKGRIIALDTKSAKLTELKKRSARAGANIIEAREITSTKVIKRLKDSADRLLLDVPCSGLGVLRRNPDAKWKLKPEEIERVKKLQQEILEQYSPLTKVGGKMVYATCSILPSEGENQVQIFLDAHKEQWKLVGEKRYSPEIFDCDGFYLALLQRIK